MAHPDPAARAERFLSLLPASFPASPRPCALDPHLVHTLAAAEQAFSREIPFQAAWGAARDLDVSRPDENVLAWTDLRALETGHTILDDAFYADSAEQRLEAALRVRVESLPVAPVLAEFADDLRDDLVFACLARARGLEHGFWFDVGVILEAGLVPCGWDGALPEGRFVALDASEIKGRGGRP